MCVLDRDGQLIWQVEVDSDPGPLIEKLGTSLGEIDLVGLEACPFAGCPCMCPENEKASHAAGTMVRRPLSGWLAAIRKHHLWFRSALETDMKAVRHGLLPC